MAAARKRILILKTREATHSFLNFRNVSRKNVRKPVRADQASGFQFFQLLHDLAKGRFAVAVVNLVKVDIVCPETFQARTDRLFNIRRGIVIEGMSVFHAYSEFRGDHDLLTGSPQRFSECALALPEAVSISGVKKGHAFLQRGMHGIEKCLLVHLAPTVAAHGAAAHTQARNTQIRVP